MYKWKIIVLSLSLANRFPHFLSSQTTILLLVPSLSLNPKLSPSFSHTFSMYLPTFLLDSASNSFFYLHFHSFCSSWNTLYVVYRANAFCFGAVFLPHPLFTKNPIIIWYYSTCTQVAIDCFFDPTFWPGSCLVLFFQTLNNSKVFFFHESFTFKRTKLCHQEPRSCFRTKFFELKLSSPTSILLTKILLPTLRSIS